VYLDSTRLRESMVVDLVLFVSLFCFACGAKTIDQIHEMIQLEENSEYNLIFLHLQKRTA